MHLVLLTLFVIAICTAILYGFAQERRREGDRALEAQALTDYQSARGTAHRRLLTELRTKLIEQRSYFDFRLRDNKAHLRALHSQRDEELHKTLTLLMVNGSLDQIPGIGSSLEQALMKQVFRGRFEDFYRAHELVDGIGPQKQSAIDAWVKQKLADMPSIMATNFEGKETIESRHLSLITAYESELSDLKQRQLQLEELRMQIDGELQWLNRFTEKDYQSALLGPQASALLPDVKRYQLGVFAPWEPPPDWLVEAPVVLNTPTN